ncbi:MAG: hypothetical protein P4L31_07425 [Candidatus Babeliales bacterium]|nr:hypothetical protein [Candidatus Babeliales bacterium]
MSLSIYAEFKRVNTYLVGTALYGDLQICIYDSVTSLPANGNNCVVNYTINNNGILTTADVTISGLSITVYSGEIYDPIATPAYVVKYFINSIAAGGGIPIDPVADDLAIVNILTTPESAIGANDGTVTINATSSFPAINYSLDGVHFQSSNIFTGQISGAGTAYVTDANGGALSQPYTVGLLGNILVSDPTVDLGNGNLSRWNAVFNNIWFKYQRKDFQITSISLDSGTGNIKVSINGDMTNVKVRTIITSTVPDQPTITSPGDFVYINTALYEGSYEVLSSSTGYLILDTPFTSNDTIGFININSLRPAYKVQTIITGVSQLTGKFFTITSNNYPFPDGHTDVDLQNFLQDLLRAKDYSGYNLINYRDMQLSASYTIKYAEVWQGNPGTFASITRPYYVLWAARQLQQIGSGNMQEFVPFLNGFQPAKWVTDFLTPVYNHLFPFDIGFIFSEYMVGLAPFYTIELLDINKNPLASQSILPGFLLNEDGSYILNQDSSKFIIAAPQLQAGLVEHVGLNRLLINFTPPNLCWYFNLQLFYTNTPASGSPVTYPLTQAITCRIDQQTTDRQIYIKWIGLTGCYQYYTFSYNQLKQLEVSNTVTVKNFIVDWQNTDTIADVISKNANEKMTVYAINVSVDDIKAIRGIKTSPQVMIYIGPVVSGYNWQQINTGDASYDEYETFIDEYAVTLTFALPALNIQFK